MGGEIPGKDNGEGTGLGVIGGDTGRAPLVELGEQVSVAAENVVDRTIDLGLPLFDEVLDVFGTGCRGLEGGGSFSNAGLEVGKEAVTVGVTDFVAGRLAGVCHVVDSEIGGG